MDYEIDRAALNKALLDLGIDPDRVPDLSPVQSPPQAPPYQPLSDSEWLCIEPYIADAIRLMRPPSAGREFIDNLLRLEHARLSTRYLNEAQESTRQRALRWALNGRLERLAADLREAGELDETRLAAFDAVAERARASRLKILGSRVARMNERSRG